MGPTFGPWPPKCAGARDLSAHDWGPGPIIGLKVEGQDIGDTVKLSTPGTVGVTAWAESILPIHRLEILLNGEVVASTENLSMGRRLEINTNIKVDGHSWIAISAM